MTSGFPRLARSSVLVRRSLPALLAGSLVVSFIGVGCGRQAEGERCSLANGDNDCNTSDDRPLVCTAASLLRNGGDGVPRCCPEDRNDYEDDRCTPRSGGTATGGGTGVGGEGPGGAGGAVDGDSGVGDGCEYTSQCQAPLVCGPQGKCQHECEGDRDCPSGQVCGADLSCVAAP